MWPAAGVREAVFSHVCSVGVDVLCAVDVFARGTVGVQGAFVVAELDGVLIDVPLSVCGGAGPDGDFKLFGLRLWHAANPLTRCAFIQGRSTAYPRVEVYQFIYTAVRVVFEVPVPVATMMRAQRYDLQAFVARGYLRWLNATQCIDPIERFFEVALKVHQRFVVHSASWRDMKEALRVTEATVALTKASKPCGFTLETQRFVMPVRDATLVIAVLVMRASVLSQELAAAAASFGWLRSDEPSVAARCLAVLPRA